MGLPLISLKFLASSWFSSALVKYLSSTYRLQTILLWSTLLIALRSLLYPFYSNAVSSFALFAQCTFLEICILLHFLNDSFCSPRPKQIIFDCITISHDRTILKWPSPCKPVGVKHTEILITSSGNNKNRWSNFPHVNHYKHPLFCKYLFRRLQCSLLAFIPIPQVNSGQEGGRFVPLKWGPSRLNFAAPGEKF